jgi:serine/threonine-protein kinase HipA
LTILGYVDGKNFRYGVSYLEIAGFLTRNGSDPKNDLRELWQKIVFSIFVSVFHTIFHQTLSCHITNLILYL